MNKVRDLFLSSDPYDSFDRSKYRTDFQGWGYGHYMFRNIIESIKPVLILEIGTWKGMSAIRMAKECDRLGLTTEIICVDTWLGSSEHFDLGDTRKNDYSVPRLHGFPTVYYTFLANVLSSGTHNRIIPLPLESQSAAEILRRAGVRPEFIYIDGAHDKSSVLRDLNLYFDILADDGVILGDDFLNIPDVSLAAVDFAESQGCYFCGDLTKFVLCKGQKFRPEIRIGFDLPNVDKWGATDADVEFLKALRNGL